MSKRILILGAGEMQGVSIRIARERGWKTVVIDGNPAAPSRNLADRFEPHWRRQSCRGGHYRHGQRRDPERNVRR